MQTRIPNQRLSKRQCVICDLPAVGVGLGSNLLDYEFYDRHGLDSASGHVGCGVLRWEFAGLMVYQAVNKVCKEDGVRLDVRGHIMDSCPGPRPKATLPRSIVFGIVNWITAKRDGMGLWYATKYTAS